MESKLAPFRSAALICKYFNLSYRDVEEWLPWDEYYILMAVALDLDELEERWQFLLAGGEEKDWKWSSPDHAGTAYPLIAGTDRRGLSGKQALNAAVKGLFKGRINPDQLPRGGTMTEYARVTGQQMVKKFIYDDGKVEYQDADGNVIQSPEGSVGFYKTEDVEVAHVGP